MTRFIIYNNKIKKYGYKKMGGWPRYTIEWSDDISDATLYLKSQSAIYSMTNGFPKSCHFNMIDRDCSILEVDLLNNMQVISEIRIAEKYPYKTKEELGIRW